MEEQTKISNEEAKTSKGPKELKEFFSFLFEIFKIVFIAALIVIPIRYFLFQPFIVKGDSMEPNFQNSDYLLIDELSFRFRDPRKGEVVVLRPPNQPSSRYIKRIVGLPGETIKIINGKVIISDQDGFDYPLDESSYLPISVFTPGSAQISLGEQEFFVLGDNRQFSSDSRVFGVLLKKEIIGRVFFRVLPLSNFSKIKAPVY